MTTAASHDPSDDGSPVRVGPVLTHPGARCDDCGARIAGLADEWQGDRVWILCRECGARWVDA